MSDGFGQYATEASGANLDAGMYAAIIESATLVLDNAGQPKETENGKKLVDVMFMVDRDNKVRRRYTIAYGQNTANGQWAAFAKLIDAAVGIKCGDKSQKAVGEAELRGQKVRIVVDQNDRGYMDVQNVLPPGKGEQQKPKPAPITDDEVPFPDDDQAPR